MTLGTIGRLALDLLYPPHCTVCGDNGTLLCATCVAALPPASGARCDVCWSPEQRCSCYYVDPSFARLRSAFRYEGEVRHLVKAFKFTGQSSLAPSLARALFASCETHDLRCDVI